MLRVDPFGVHEVSGHLHWELPSGSRDIPWTNVADHATDPYTSKEMTAMRALVPLLLMQTWTVDRCVRALIWKMRWMARGSLRLQDTVPSRLRGRTFGRDHPG